MGLAVVLAVLLGTMPRWQPAPADTCEPLSSVLETRISAVLIEWRYYTSATWTYRIRYSVPDDSIEGRTIGLPRPYPLEPWRPFLVRAAAVDSAGNIGCWTAPLAVFP